MIVTTIHQPSFFPWLGLLDKIAKSQNYILLDNVHANKASNQYRNIFYCNGLSKYISIPVDYNINKLISELKFKNNLWKEEHLNKFYNYYLKSPFFDEIFPLIQDVYNSSYESPIDFIINTMLFAFNMFKINVDIIKNSELNSSGSKGRLVLDICKKTNTKVYLSGQGAMNYMDEDILKEFHTNGIKVIWHAFEHPIYNQDMKYNFVSGLSFLDILFFEGIENANRIFWLNVNKERINNE